MWSWRNPKGKGCRRFGEEVRTALESSEAERFEDFLAAAEPSTRQHLAKCEGCRTELSDALLARRLLRGSLPATSNPGQLFTSQVMKAIAEEEFRRRAPASAWLAIPKMAARIAWVSAVILIFASTWLYEQRPATGAKSVAKNVAADVFLEPPPQPATQDEVLLSLAEREP